MKVTGIYHASILVSGKGRAAAWSREARSLRSALQGGLRHMRIVLARVALPLATILSVSISAPPVAAAPPAARAATPQPSPLATNKVEIALPDSVGQVEVGAGGRFLVMHLPGVRKLAIFDANAAKIVKYISLAADGAQFTAGAEKLFVAYPGSRVLQRYSLSTFEKELTVALPVQTKLHCLLIGSNSRGPLMMGGNVLRFYDPITLREEKYQWVGGEVGMGDQYTPVVEVSADGRMFTARTPTLSPGDTRIFRLQGRSIRAFPANSHSSRSSLLPNTDGSAVFSSSRILTPDGKPIPSALDNPRISAWLLPAVQDRYYLSLVKTPNPGTRSESEAHLEASLHILGQERALLPLPELAPSLAGLVDFHSGDVQPLEQHIHFLPASGIVAIIPLARDRLIIHRLSIREALEKSGLDYLVVHSRPPDTFSRGKEFTYQVQAMAKRGGVKFSLDSGPEGMTITPAGLLRWKVPPDYAGEEEHIILTISDATGQEVFHTFRVVRQ